MSSPAPISARELVLQSIAHRENGRIPHMIECHASIARRLEGHYGVADLGAILNNSVEWIGDRLSMEEMTRLGILQGDEYTDDWGVRWHGVGETRGQVKRPALADATLQGYKFPPYLRPETRAQMRAQAIAAGGRYRVAKVGALWEQATFVRGMADLLVDLLLHPRFVHELLDGILCYLLRTLDVLAGEVEFDCVWLSDDYGSQDSLLMSPALWRTFIGPRVRQLCDTAHARGYHFALHSDGAVCDVIRDVVGMGVDLLHPVQSECVDVHRVKQEFGRDLTLFGGYGNQGTLAFGMPAQVRAEVDGLCAALSAGGGFILAPGLGLMPETPVENAVAFIEVANEWERGR